MPTRVVPVKLTAAENDLLDWLMVQLSADSRSQALRLALVETARSAGLQATELERIRDERRAALPRRSKQVIALHGPRERGPRSIPESA